MGVVSLRAHALRDARRGLGPGVLVALVLTGCSLVNDTGEVQCRTNDDCTTRFGGAAVAYSCENSFCVRPLCTTDVNCSSRGERYASSVCGTDGLCASPATVACTRVEDCNSKSPTVQCVDGACEDKAWGCRGLLDNRPAATERTATLTMRIYNLLTRMPVPTVSAKVCNLPTFDIDCAQPLVQNGLYNPQTATVTIPGVPQDTPVRVKLDFPGTDLIAVDHYSMRPPRDLTDLGLVTTMPRSLVPQVTAVLDPPRNVDPMLGIIWSGMRDCDGQLATGVSIKMMDADRVPGSEIIYFGADGQPAPQATGTEAFGSALIINAKAGKLLTLQATLGELPVAEYRFIAFAGRSTFVSFWPRVYR